MTAPSEFDLQRALTIWTKGERWAAGSAKGQWKIEPALLPGVVAWHTPNGGKREAFEAKRLVQSGVEAGIPDYFFLWGTLYFLELKEPGGNGRLSPAQERVLPRLRAAGAVGRVVDNLADAKAAVTEWGLVATHPL